MWYRNISKVSCIIRKSKIEINEEFVHESIVGSLFKGCVINTTNVENIEAVVTKITGSAWLMGMHRFFTMKRIH